MSEKDPHPERYFIDPGQEPLPGLEEWAPPAARDKEELAPIAASDKVAAAGASAPSTSTRVAARVSARSRSKAREKQSSRGFQVLEVFLVGLTVTVGILIFAVAILLMRPSGDSNLFADLNANLRATLGPSYVTAEQAVGGVIGRGKDGYEARVAPIVKRVAGTAGIKVKSSEVVKGKDADLELFLKCYECHTLYTYRSALGGIYIDHNIHGMPWEEEARRKAGVKDADIKKAEATATEIASGAKQADDEEDEEAGEHGKEGGHEEDPAEIAKRLICKSCHNDVPKGEPESAAHFVTEMTCARCHIDADLHAKDERELQGVMVPEKTCYECHINKNQKDAQVKDIKTCRFCHAPGWYFADNVGGAAFVSEEKTERFLEGRQVHKKKLDSLTFSRPSLSGEKRKFCARCHVRDSFCNDCHQVVQGSHKNRDWFIKNHGPNIVKKQIWAATQCWECHSGNWCARKCHMNGPKSRGNPNRSTGRYPIPWKNLKDAD